MSKLGSPVCFVRGVICEKLKVTLCVSICELPQRLFLFVILHWFASIDLNDATGSSLESLQQSWSMIQVVHSSKNFSQYTNHGACTKYLRLQCRWREKFAESIIDNHPITITRASSTRSGQCIDIVSEKKNLRSRKMFAMALTKWFLIPSVEISTAARNQGEWWASVSKYSTRLVLLFGHEALLLNILDV